MVRRICLNIPNGVIVNGVNRFNDAVQMKDVKAIHIEVPAKEVSPAFTEGMAAIEHELGELFFVVEGSVNRALDIQCIQMLQKE